MRSKKIISLVVVSIITCVCLTLGGGLTLGFGLSRTIDGLMAKPAETATPQAATYQPAERPAPRGQLLLADDFSQEKWKVASDNDHRKGYADERYFIVVNVPQYNYWSLSQGTYQDFILEVETIQLAGPVDNDYGVILRHQDDANFYSFEISSDGFYTFTKLVDDQLFNIIPWRESRVIKPKQGNILRVEAVGPNFTFYLNDKLVDAAIDSDFSQGDIGLVVGTNQEAGAHVAFDNLKVWSAEKIR
ncbi:MAG: hypothetical protein JXM69_18485 [Anaerolineae bacterium]|nr:hypothetical protein [Anaerolineae bacterium]